jgi:hypothetical protein
MPLPCPYQQTRAVAEGHERLPFTSPIQDIAALSLVGGPYSATFQGGSTGSNPVGGTTRKRWSGPK